MPMRSVLPFSFAILLASAALAGSSGPEALVEREFVAPFTAWQAARGEFSRAEMPPSQMRVRVLSAPQADAQGAEFVAFAVDTRDVDGDWNPAQMTGCVYVASSAVYVKRGTAFLAAADYFGQAPEPRPAVCTAP